MADITQISVNGVIRNVKDATGRILTTQAQTTAETAQTTAETAQTTAETAQTTANAAVPKAGGQITGSLSVIGALTSEQTPTNEIDLKSTLTRNRDNVSTIETFNYIKKNDIFLVRLRLHYIGQATYDEKQLCTFVSTNWPFALAKTNTNYPMAVNGFKNVSPYSFPLRLRINFATKEITATECSESDLTIDTGFILF